MPASGLLPPSKFASRPLVTTTIGPGSVWHRLYQSRFPDPLGFGFGPSRFSDPLTGLAPPGRFGVVYIDSSIKVCFLEAILRERGVGRTSTFPLEWSELETWTCAEIAIETELTLVDLRGDGLVRMGIPTDAARSSTHDLGQTWSRAIWTHDDKPDGIAYDSRLNGESNIAVFDRALFKFRLVRTPRLVDCRTDLAAILNDFDLVIV